MSGIATIVGGLLWAVGASTSLNEEPLGITMRGPLFYLGATFLILGSLFLGIVVLRTSKARFFGAPLLAIGVLGILMVIFLMGPFAETALGTVVLPTLFGLAWTVLGYALWSYEAKRPAIRILR